MATELQEHPLILLVEGNLGVPKPEGMRGI
ncbi:MAG: hypothetical protein CM15mP78_06960 [Candidatus Poseidoniales archaeon]|nr:MAG: hypothetical protein CM15mP78_06960 [Candidatus Poseidoniales archaeon]